MSATKFTRILCLVLFLGLSWEASAQLQMPRPSPNVKLVQEFGLMNITLEYSSPGVKGRQVFGDLVPYGSMWRTGANNPTKISFDKELMFEGKKVAPGTYTLMTIPKEKSWTIILNKDTQGNGVFSYDEADDVIRFDVASFPLTDMIESFTMLVTDLSDTEANLMIAWEKTGVKIKLSNDAEKAITAQINQVLNPKPNARTLYQIASYYYRTDQNSEKALELASQSVKMEPRFWSMHLKANLEAKLNKKEAAIASAKKSIEMAKEAKNEDYVRLNEKLLQKLAQ